jgi:UDP-N-acetylglucosamine--N-acetylmuramyl-(pentapeptide) pyrophosphoryl-undecaprenol N-acetylglucosamine transferase
MNFKKRAYVLAAGGTGGHLFPALSLAKELKRRGNLVFLFTDERAAKWVDPRYSQRSGPEANCRNEVINDAAKHLDGVMVSRFLYTAEQKKTGKINFLYRLLLCGLKSFFLFLRKRPLAVVGFGGYPSAPPVLAAQMLFIPTIIHEANIILGRANAILSKRAKCVATGFAEVQGVHKKQFVSGNPVRDEIKSLYTVPYQEPEHKAPFHLLVIGGSQGAQSLVELIPFAISQIRHENRHRLHVKQQVPAEFLPKSKALYAGLGVHFELSPFFYDMKAALAWAHLVVTRGGATSLAEIMVAGRPSLIIPLTDTKDGDQVANALYYSDHWAAVSLNITENSLQYLGPIISAFMSTTGELQERSENARKLAIPDADVLLADQVLKYARS